MTTGYERVRARYAERAKSEQQLMETGGPALFARRDEFLLEVGEEAAEFLHALVVARGARRLIELGTSYGFSTLFLADAARRTGGKLVTYELSADKQSFAREQLVEAGLADHVEWRLGDAVELLAGDSDPVDFVLIDLWKDLYLPCFELVRPRLTENAVIAADNMLFPPMSRPEAEQYRAAVRAASEFQTVLLPIGSGIELSCVWREPPKP